MNNATADESNPPMNKMRNFSSPTLSANAMLSNPIQIASMATPNIITSVNRSRKRPKSLEPGGRITTGAAVWTSSLAKIASFAINIVFLGARTGAGILIKENYSIRFLSIYPALRMIIRIMRRKLTLQLKEFKQ